MPRPPRINVPNVTFHIVQRGNDRRKTFFAENDYRTYLLTLARISRRYQTSVHAYVLMSNHVHLLMTSQHADGISRTMQQLSSSFARYINQLYERTGTLWEGRFLSSPIDSDFYCLACYRYIELNPVRAGLVAHPSDYRWSSHLENTGRGTLSIVEAHASYLAIASSPARRREGYARLFETSQSTAEIGALRHGARKGTPVGSDRFCKSIEVECGQKIGSRRRGRPPKDRRAHRSNDPGVR